MGWTNSHLHRFVIHGKEYGRAYDGGMGFANDPKRITLADFRFRLRERFVYEYDFNEHWQHDFGSSQLWKQTRLGRLVVRACGTR
jgi:hypothetical protein